MQSNGLEKHKLITFYNGAPQKFFLDSEEAPALKKILLISNHPPKEILHALKILNKKITVQIKIIGKGLDMYKRLTPKDFMWADAVITIGKSVQYAIASKKAIFCYDHFGGPGWITRKNYKRAEWYNYSGRCCGTKLTPEEIAFELETNFLFAQKEIRHIHNETKERYNFNSFLNKIISKHTQTTRNSFQLNDSDIALIRTETNFAKNLRRLYRENLQHKHSTISVKLLINKAWRKIQNICSEVKFFI